MHRPQDAKTGMLYKYHGCPFAKIDKALYPSP